MCSRFLINLATATAALLMAGCGGRAPPEKVTVPAPAATPDMSESALSPGMDHTPVTSDPQAAGYYDNADAVFTGKRLFQQYNCSGCHSNGGGGMGPSLMDGGWIYGGRLDQIHHTLVEGRPNGMPAWGGKVPDPQLWQLSAYVRSLSLPQTLAAQNGPTPSQTPAPVPRAADQDSGWSPPPGTSNYYGATTLGPN